MDDKEEENFDNVIPYTPRDILISQRNDTLKKFVKMQVELKVLSRTDGDLVVLKEPATFADDGVTPLSYIELTAKQVTERYKVNISGYETRLSCIDMLIEEEENKEGKK